MAQFSAESRAGFIRLYLLGPIELTRADGTPLQPILAQPKRLALLAYLALHAGGFCRRGLLREAFWPEYDEARARAALRRALYFLRQSLGPEVMVGRGDEEVGLNAGSFWCDARAFNQALRDNRSDDALALYRGDLLSAFSVPDAAEFERWLDVERQRMRLAAAGVATRLAELAEARGEVADAVRLAKVAITMDPDSEPRLRHLVKLLVHSGDRAHAAHTYAVWERRLRSDYDIAPSAETRRAVGALLEDDAATALPARVPASLPMAHRS